jgi:hypothetical protein
MSENPALSEGMRFRFRKGVECVAFFVPSDLTSTSSPRYTQVMKLLFDFFKRVLFRQAGMLINTAIM